MSCEGMVPCRLLYFRLMDMMRPSSSRRMPSQWFSGWLVSQLALKFQLSPSVAL